MAQNTRTGDLTSGPMLQKIILFSLPLAASSILQLLFNAADVVVVGRFAGSTALAAVGSNGALINLLVNLFVGLSLGANVVAARCFGAKDERGVQNTVQTSVTLGLVSGVLLAFVGFFAARGLLELMSCPEDVIGLSTLYLKIYFIGMPMTMLYNFSAALLRAVGDTRRPLYCLAVSGIINVVLNLVFVILFQMSVAGVALATIISQALSAVLVVIALMRRTDACKLYLSKMRFYKPQLEKILRIGLPAGIQSALFSISNVLIQSSVNSFGDVFMSGNAASSNIEGFVYVCLNAFQQSAVNFAGQNAGARQYRRVRQTLWICLGCVTVVGLVLGSLAYALGPSLLSIYITDSAEAISYGLIRLAFICLPYFLCGLMDVTTGALRGIGASFVPMLISILGVCGLRIVWIYTIFQIPEFHTPQCLYFSYTVSWIITFIAQLIAFFVVYRRQASAAE